MSAMTPRQRAEQARDAPSVTCAASRHVMMLADAIETQNEVFDMIKDDPQECADSLYATLAALWEARTEIARLKATPTTQKPALPAGEG